MSLSWELTGNVTSKLLLSQKALSPILSKEVGNDTFARVEHLANAPASIVVTTEFSGNLTDRSCLQLEKALPDIELMVGSISILPLQQSSVGSLLLLHAVVGVASILDDAL